MGITAGIINDRETINVVNEKKHFTSVMPSDVISQGMTSASGHSSTSVYH